MAVLDGIKAANENLLVAAKIGAAAALNAPKLANTQIKMEILTDEEVAPLIEILGIIGETNAFVSGDALVGKRALEAGTPIIELLIGVDGTTSDLAWNCGACGFNTCAEFNRYSRENRGAGAFFTGPNCCWKNFDFGMAQSWAAAAIAEMGVECRCQASYGFAGLVLGYLEGCTIATAVSIGPAGESIWYDRRDLTGSFTMKEHEQFMMNTLPQLYVAFCGGGFPLLKHRPDWAAEPLFWKAKEDPEFMAKQEDIRARVTKVIEREKAKKLKK